MLSDYTLVSKTKGGIGDTCGGLSSCRNQKSCGVRTCQSQPFFCNQRGRYLSLLAKKAGPQAASDALGMEMVSEDVEVHYCFADC